MPALIKGAALRDRRRFNGARCLTEPERRDHPKSVDVVPSRLTSSAPGSSSATSSKRATELCLAVLCN